MARAESPGALTERYRDALRALEASEAVARLSRRDPTLWRIEPEHVAIIRERLGWLDAPAWLASHAAELTAFGHDLRQRGFTHARLLGMGGSSLAAEVLARTQPAAPGAPTLEILDSTDPAAVASVEREARLDRTYFLVASKSGRTVETLSQYRYFRGRLEAEAIAEPGSRFAAITDPGSPLERLAASEGFERVFLNPADVGGRYSALTYFGMVPAAILGLDLQALASSAGRARAESLRSTPEENPALRLAAWMGAAAKGGRDKLTLVTSDRLRPLGDWIEQLVAESTGKDGVGLLPVEGRPLGSPRRYGEDRCFVAIDAGSGFLTEIEPLAQEIRRLGAPWASIDLESPAEIAGEFFRWEVATALACSLLGVDPFNEPDVSESKERTSAILSEFKATGAWPLREPRTRDQGVEVRSPDALWKELTGAAPSHPSLEMILGRFLVRAETGEYVAILAYVERTAASEAALLRACGSIRDALALTAVHSYGPRYLHSTGQIHKGGPKKGHFIEITVEDQADLAIPETGLTFGALKRAQALGDLASLEARGLPALHLHLTRGVDAGLAVIGDALERALAALASR